MSGRVVLSVDGQTVFDSGQAHGSPAVQAVAAQFAGLTDDEQAQFFEEVGRIMRTWDGQPTSWGSEWQQHAIGEHMASCKCITDVGRDMLRTITRAMEHHACKVPA